MSLLGTTDAPLDIFGGLVTDMSPADLPAGVSPDCADVTFIPGAVKTRPGLLSMYTPIAGNPTVNYVKTFIQPNLTETLLALDSGGTLWGELTPGSLTQVASGIVAGAPARRLFSAANTSLSPTANSASTCPGSSTARISIA